MSDATDSTTSSFRREVGRLKDDLGRMVQLRAELVRSELKTDATSARRLAVVAGIGGLALLTGLPLAVLLAGEQLALWLDVDRRWVLGGVAGLLIVGGPILAWTAWRRFRRQVIALEQTRAELREDWLWCRQWFED